MNSVYTIVKILNEYIKELNPNCKGLFAGYASLKKDKTFPIIKTYDMQIFFIENKIKTPVFSLSVTERVPTDKEEAFKEKCSQELMCQILIEKYKLDELRIK